MVIEVGDTVRVALSKIGGIAWTVDTAEIVEVRDDGFVVVRWPNGSLQRARIEWVCKED